jgi:hypothetical protein
VPTSRNRIHALCSSSFLTTGIEEELHEKAHIDYDTVAIVSTIDSNTTFAPSSPVLFVRSPTPQLLPFTKMR